ncbi:MAG: hypothetical protein D6722_20950, partial [Bacteroidetes bacterium]
MRSLCLFLLCLPLALPAQDAYHTNLLSQLQQDYGLSGGSWLLPPSEQTFVTQATTYGCTRQSVAISGQSFAQALRLTVDSAGTNPWEAGLALPSTQSVQAGDRVLITVWLRAQGPPAEVTLFAEDAVTYAKEVYLTLELDSSWQQVFISFESSDSYPVEDLNLGFHLAHRAQTVDIAGMNALNYGTSFPLADLPVQFPVYYAGQESDAPWRAAAAARIAQHRQADLSLRLVDKDNQPLPNT